MSDESTVIEDVEAVAAEETRSLEGESIGSGRYCLGPIVGQGGFGRVYRARELGSDRTWAVKELAFNGSRPILDSLDKEQKVLSWLDHPAIVTRREVLSERDRVFLVMEFIEGANLKQRLAESELSMPQIAVVELALQICEALIYLHGQKPYPIIFSDLKPSNLMLTDEGKVKLIDFGIARVKAPGSDNSLAMGTRGYAAPEQYAREALDARTDIYALGVVMHQLLSKLEPRKHRGELPPVEYIATAVDKELAALIARATRHQREQRYPSVQHLKRALEALLAKWGTRRAEAREELIHWAGLEPRDRRLVNAIEDSVQEVQNNRSGRARPWVKVWSLDRAQRRALATGVILLGACFLLSDGLDVLDVVVLGIVLLSVFVWKMKTL